MRAKADRDEDEFTPTHSHHFDQKPPRLSFSPLPTPSRTSPRRAPPASPKTRPRVEHRPLSMRTSSPQHPPARTPKRPLEPPNFAILRRPTTTQPHNHNTRSPKRPLEPPHIAYLRRLTTTQPHNHLTTNNTRPLNPHANSPRRAPPASPKTRPRVEHRPLSMRTSSPQPRPTRTPKRPLEPPLIAILRRPTTTQPHNHLTTNNTRPSQPTRQLPTPRTSGALTPLPATPAHRASSPAPAPRAPCRSPSGNPRSVPRSRAPEDPPPSRCARWRRPRPRR